jgi:hypothetical protein
MIVLTFVFFVTGIPARGGFNCSIIFYSIIADCPAMKLILNHIGNNGYYCCWLCKVKGVHIQELSKRQYYFREPSVMRTVQSYVLESKEAEEQCDNVNGHIGVSVLHALLDVPLPYSVLIDYMHVSLLRHTHAITLQLYAKLKPKKERSLITSCDLNNFLTHSIGK